MEFRNHSRGAYLRNCIFYGLLNVLWFVICLLIIAKSALFQFTQGSGSVLIMRYIVELAIIHAVSSMVL